MSDKPIPERWKPKYLTAWHPEQRQLIEELGAAEAALSEAQQENKRLLVSSPLQRWVCFFCEFATSDSDEAAAHFGDRDDAEEFKPICKWWQRMSAEEKVAALQDTIQQLNYEQMESYKQDKQIGQLTGDLGEARAQVAQLQATICTLTQALEKYRANCSCGADYDETGP